MQEGGRSAARLTRVVWQPWTFGCTGWRAACEDAAAQVADSYNRDGSLSDAGWSSRAATGG
ncbi:MAG: hypothetical protein ACKN81_16050 [Pirellulaceae bacterium]